MQNLFDTLYDQPFAGYRDPHERLTPSTGVLRDLDFWEQVLPPQDSPWDGRFQFAIDSVDVLPLAADEVVTTDAAATYGWGAKWRGKAATSRWSPDELETEHSTHIELHGILGALERWGTQWCGKCILVWTDNLGAMGAVNCGST